MSEDGWRGGADWKFYVIDGTFESSLAGGLFGGASRHYIRDEEVKKLFDSKLVFLKVYEKPQKLK